MILNKNFDINHPSLRMAQSIADRTGREQAMVRNFIGGFNIRNAVGVDVLFNNSVYAIVKPIAIKEESV